MRDYIHLVVLTLGALTCLIYIFSALFVAGVFLYAIRQPKFRCGPPGLPLNHSDWRALTIGQLIRIFLFSSIFVFVPVFNTLIGLVIFVKDILPRIESYRNWINHKPFDK